MAIHWVCVSWGTSSPAARAGARARSTVWFGRSQAVPNVSRVKRLPKQAAVVSRLPVSRGRRRSCSSIRATTLSAMCSLRIRGSDQHQRGWLRSSQMSWRRYKSPRNRLKKKGLPPVFSRHSWASACTWGKGCCSVSASNWATSSACSAPTLSARLRPPLLPSAARSCCNGWSGGTSSAR